LISLLALAVAWAYVTLPGIVAMGILAASAVPITVVANTARIVVTALVGQTLGPEYAHGFFHTFSGWMIFLVALVCLVVVHHLIQIGTAWSKSRP
jgi:exosortase/archaeosortase family protein